MAAPRILFLDDDHVLRVLRLVLAGQEHDPSILGWFHPERPDLAPLVEDCAGLRTAGGGNIGLQGAPGAALEDAQVIVFRRGRIDAELLARHPSLRLVLRLGLRPEGVGLAALQARGIPLVCTPRRTLYYTAEHAMLLMLALGKRLLAADAAMRRAPPASTPAAPGGVAYNWLGVAGATGLHGHTLGIVGLGEVGSLVAPLARAFGMRVLYTKRSRADAATEQALGVQFAPLDELLAASDYVSLHVANTPQTQRFADRAFFARMKPTAFFVNTSRGALVDEDALHEALVAKTIAGAGLDVHASEPRPAGDRFLALDNVVLSPHVGGGSLGDIIGEYRFMVSHIKAALGMPPGAAA